LPLGHINLKILQHVIFATVPRKGVSHEAIFSLFAATTARAVRVETPATTTHQRDQSERPSKQH